MDDDIDNMDFALPDADPVSSAIGSTLNPSTFDDLGAYHGIIPEHIIKRLKALSLSPESFMAHHPSCFSKDIIKSYVKI